uniref:MFS domain-containing protein n=1 Tax=Meloidogyne hapla TaxID=6305 RepID=A0A1I8AX10_MELHA
MNIITNKNEKQKFYWIPTKMGRNVFVHSIRYLIVISSLISFTLVSANTTSFSLTIICMVEGSNGNTTEEELSGKDTAYFKLPKYSLTEKNSLFSAAALGSIISGLAITSLIGRFGLRNVLSAYGFISGLAALALPLAAAFGFIPMFIIRMIQGSAGPAQYVMIGTFGRVLGLPLSSIFCSPTLGWALLYILLGSMTIISFMFFFIIFRERPEIHPLITGVELQKLGLKPLSEKLALAITTDTTEEETSRSQPIPYKAILSDCVVWLVLLTYWSDEIGFEMLGQFGPTYLNRVLGIDIRTTGIISALTYLLSVGVKVLAGWIYNHLPFKGERARINLFTALTQIGMSSCFISLAFLPLAKWFPLWSVQFVYTLVNLFCGLDFLGVIRCSQRISQQFSHVLMAWNSMISSITILLLPLFVTLIAPNNYIHEWSRMYIIIGIFQLIMMTFFFIFCDTKQRDWTIRNNNITTNSSDTSKEESENN